MSRMKKLYQKYERWVLIGLVVMLLATFSIAGAAQCGSSDRGRSFQMGGNFKVSPAEREEISDQDFDRMYARWTNFQYVLRMPSREFRRYVMGTQPPESFKAAWGHRLAYEAAAAAGYKAGERQVTTAVEDMVGFALGVRSRLPFSDVNYQKFLEDFRGSQADFRESVAQIVAKDGFLYPIISAARYQVTYPQAYEEWKRERERVDLQSIALPSAPFAEVVRQEETSRSTIGTLEDALRDVTSVAASVRRVHAKVVSIHKETGSYPKTLEAIKSYRVVPDAWKTAIRYTLVDGKPDVRSAGPDKAFDTADDVTVETQKQLDTHGALFDLASKVKKGRTADGTWPAKLADLENSPGDSRLPGVAKTPKDGWDHEFVYAPGADAKAAPTLASMGPDGEAGTGDDIRITLSPDEILVPPGPVLAAYVPADAKDAWGRAMRIVLRRAQPATWRVASAGLDGDFATADDNLVSGNQRELKSFFAPLRGDYIEEARREFETLFVHLPLVTDAALARLWKAYPQHRPTDEEALFHAWRPYRDVFYKTADPRDAETGHGAALVKDLAPKAAGVLVPAASLFPDALSKPGVAKEEEEPKEEEPKEGEVEKDDADSESEERAIFQKMGWREILIRQRFMENLLSDILKRCRESTGAMKRAEAALAAWEKTKARNDASLKAWDEKYKGKPDDEATPPRPEAFADAKPDVRTEITFETILQGELAELVVSGDENTPAAIQYWKTPAPMTREEYEENKDFQKGLQFELNRLSADGDYNNVPAQLRTRLTKVLVRRLSHSPQRSQDYDEVKDKVFDRFVEKRQMDRAAKRLKALQEAILKAESDLGEDATDEAKANAANQVIAAASKGAGFSPIVETSGLFIGNSPPPSLEVGGSSADGDSADGDSADGDSAGGDLSDDEKARRARRNLIWRQGYATVRPTASLQDTVTAEVGTFGRRVLQDPRQKDPVTDEYRGSGNAYLVRVVARIYPSKHEFSPRRYTQFLSQAVFGDRSQRERSLRDYKGRYYKSLSRWFANMDWIQGKFDLQTNSELNVLEKRQRR